LTGYAELSK